MARNEVVANEILGDKFKEDMEAVDTLQRKFTSEINKFADGEEGQMSEDKIASFGSLMSQHANHVKATVALKTMAFKMKKGTL